jgi:uncharacterized membrane protein YphA (DoxX/SURF4 family)
VNERPITVERVAYVPAALVVALVLLRLATGWHFYREGTKKLVHDKGTGEISVANYSEPVLRAAVGPWAEWFKRDLPNFHEWERLLIVPKRGPTSQEELAARSRWLGDYNKRRQEAEKAKKPAPIEFPPGAPYTEWANRIDEDWQDVVAKFQQVEGLTKEQLAAAADVLQSRRLQLADYLASQENSFADWQHELWRLGDWEAADDATGLPFQSSRIADKKAETSGASAGWIDSVRSLEAGLYRDLRGLLTAAQESKPEIVAAVNDSLGDAQEKKLHRINVAMMCLVTGIGVCLFLGLFTRLAALAGIAFLVSVIATQPPWVPGAITTVFYYQTVEITALLVLLAAGAGRWAGLDFFLRAWWTKRSA